jgi:hypothetical protein
MDIQAKEGEWTVVDEEQLAGFLNTPTGRRFIPALVAVSPGLLPGGDINAILIRSGEVRAFQSIIENILLLAHPSDPKSSALLATSYPPPEDDRFWNDGQKLVQATEETAPAPDDSPNTTTTNPIEYA